MTEPWGHEAKNAYKLGIAKGKKIAAEETEEKERELPTLIDRFAMAALGSLDNRNRSYFEMATEAYHIADAMMYARNKRGEIDDEIPF